jgi:hypothetical protein
MLNSRISVESDTLTIYISVGTLILTVPLSIVGNMISPHAANWWASRSSRRTTARVAVLEKRIETLTNGDISHRLDSLAAACWCAMVALAGLLFAGIAATLVCTVLVARELTDISRGVPVRDLFSSTPWPLRPAEMAALLTYTVCVFSSARWAGRAKLNFAEASAELRDKRVDRLKADLDRVNRAIKNYRLMV